MEPQWLALGVLVGWALHIAYELLDPQKFGGNDPRKSKKSSSRVRYTEELKMVLVVNESLKMGKGKIGAQCAHAAVGLVEEVAFSEPGLLNAWARGGQAKICLRGLDTPQLKALRAEARRQGLATYLVQDAGRTQVEPGSRTVLAIGPAPKSQIDLVTGDLKLL
ncbi:PTH2 peptidyl-tRNA hydrolase [Helicosporidium sp. ATCC 50920]|nr:PTH2 peptidyl-tRNA hydrolase [Helicosporidium sp. ATCC 50920]|eukprot:KDD77140.1 PTH2 peptidyl-tRNA hydrolase [Helicosporidium sp. ATCC 50920]